MKKSAKASEESCTRHPEARLNFYSMCEFELSWPRVKFRKYQCFRQVALYIERGENFQATLITSSPLLFAHFHFSDRHYRNTLRN